MKKLGSCLESLLVAVWIKRTHELIWKSKKEIKAETVKDKNGLDLLIYKVS